MHKEGHKEFSSALSRITEVKTRDELLESLNGWSFIDKLRGYIDAFSYFLISSASVPHPHNDVILIIASCLFLLLAF
jgi:hypothetical protein